MTITRRPSLWSVSRARFVTAGAIDPKLCTYVPLGKSNSQTKFRSSLILANLVWPPGGQNRKHKKCYNYWTNGRIISKFSSLVSVLHSFWVERGGCTFFSCAEKRFLTGVENTAGISNKDTWHNTRHQYWHVSLLFDLELPTLCEHVSRHHLPFYHISARSDFKYCCQVAILGEKKKCYYSWTQAKTNDPHWLVNLCMAESMKVKNDVGEFPGWALLSGHVVHNSCSVYRWPWTNGWISSKFSSLVYLISIHDIIPRFLIWPTFEGHWGQSSKCHH
jgi:hypothetical protein